MHNYYLKHFSYFLSSIILDLTVYRFVKINLTFRRLYSTDVKYIHNDSKFQRAISHS